MSEVSWWVRLWGWLCERWLDAQGVPDGPQRWKWKEERSFVRYPPICVVCGKSWRPDRPWYISLLGRTRYVIGRSDGSIEWYCPQLNIVSTTGLAPDRDQIFQMCVEHGDQWVSVKDCVTGERVVLELPPLRALELGRDVIYWGGSVLRVIWLVGRWGWSWLMWTLFRHQAEYVRVWPYLRQRPQELEERGCR